LIKTANVYSIVFNNRKEDHVIMRQMMLKGLTDYG
jgi:hypothetical protein